MILIERQNNMKIVSLQANSTLIMYNIVKSNPYKMTQRVSNKLAYVCDRTMQNLNKIGEGKWYKPSAYNKINKPSHST